MKYFECNHPDSAGYMVAYNNSSGVVDLAVHKRHETLCESMFEDLPREGLSWMYMPLDEGEYITHIWSLADAYLDHDDLPYQNGLAVGPRSVRRPYVEYLR